MSNWGDDSAAHAHATQVKLQVHEQKLAQLEAELLGLGKGLVLLKYQLKKAVDEVVEVLADDAVPPGTRKAAVEALRRLAT